MRSAVRRTVAELAKLQSCMVCRPVRKAVSALWIGVHLPGVSETTASYMLDLSGECELTAGRVSVTI